MKDSVLILEDNHIQLNALKNLIESTSFEFTVYTASSYVEADMVIKSNVHITLFLIDIDLGNNPDIKDGLDFARFIRAMPNYEFTPIVYITSISDRLDEALTTTHCYEYIRKPYSNESIIEVVEKLLRFPKTEPSFLTIKGIHDSTIHVEPGNIIYIEAYGHEITLYTEKGTMITKSYSLKKLLSMLPDYFIQCHKSYVVNSHFVIQYNLQNHTINLSDIKKELPIGRRYQQLFNNKILKNKLS